MAIPFCNKLVEENGRLVVQRDFETLKGIDTQRVDKLASEVNVINNEIELIKAKVFDDNPFPTIMMENGNISYPFKIRTQEKFSFGSYTDGVVIFDGGVLFQSGKTGIRISTTSDNLVFVVINAICSVENQAYKIPCAYSYNNDERGLRVDLYIGDYSRKVNELSFSLLAFTK